MGKSYVGVYLTAADELRERAARAGCSMSDLADLFVRVGLEKWSDDALQKWAAGRTSTRGRLAGGLTKNERAVLAALTQLQATGEGAWIFPASAVGATAGLRNMATLEALGSLARRGMVAQWAAEVKATNRWGRPVQTLWAVAGAHEAPVPPAPGEIPGLREIREELADWIVAGGDFEALWEIMPTIRAHLSSLKDADPVVKALALRDLTRATGLRPAEIADPLEG